jgi:hypothetical protein
MIISWMSTKQTLIATSTDYFKIIALYEVACECVWLRRVIKQIQSTCGIEPIRSPTIIYEDNTTYVAQMPGCVKSNVTKYITHKFFTPTNFKKVVRLVSYKLNRVIILLFSHLLHEQLASRLAPAKMTFKKSLVIQTHSIEYPPLSLNPMHNARKDK